MKTIHELLLDAFTMFKKEAVQKKDGDLIVIHDNKKFLIKITELELGLEKE
jgi:hypothetical protein